MHVAYSWSKAELNVFPRVLWRWLRGFSPLALVAGGVLVLHLFVALTGPLWAPFSSTQVLVGTPLSPPSTDFLMGTDRLGRDVFSRVVYGSRAVMALSLSATALGVIIGSTLGILLGYIRGWLDEFIMRIVDIVISIPPLILALLVIGSLGSSPLLLVLTVGLIYAPRVARVVRAATLEVVTEDFITIARARGESAISIAMRELLPNVLSTIFVEFAIRSGYAVIFIGGLGFLGFGASPPTPEWGLMINEGRDDIYAAWWPVLAPAFGIASLVVALNLFTDALARRTGQTMHSRN